MTEDSVTITLNDLLSRSSRPEPWVEGDNIPWCDAGFSERMLREHLSQDHDLASRRSARIEEHVVWIHERLLGGKPARVLDLCCGPGLYTTRLARLGHECFGIDFGPASIAHAEESAQGLPCSHRCEDIRIADYGPAYDLVMLIFGEFNVFRPTDARSILRACRNALRPDGLLLLEAHTFEAVRRLAEPPVSWRTSERGVFSDRPYLCLEERFWDEACRAATVRYFIVDAMTAGVSRHACSYQAYTEADYRVLLAECGFGEVDFQPSLTGESDITEKEGLVALTARPAAGL
jgi:SAM-dependent methyltransferase